MGYDENTAGRYGMIENIDDNFGLLDEEAGRVEGLGQHARDLHDRQRTGADRSGKLNGKKVDLFTAGFKTGKGSPYEGGTHVPAFWRWKGVLGEGVDIPALTAHIDLLPDLLRTGRRRNSRAAFRRSTDDRWCRCSRIPKAEWPDRQSVRSSRAAGPKGADPNDSQVQELCRPHAALAIRQQQGVVRHRRPIPTRNRTSSTEHPEVVAELRKAYDQWWSETVPLMVNEDAPYAPQQPQAVRYEKQKADSGIPDWTPPKL